MMAQIIYTLCMLTSLVTACLLLRGFYRSGARLLLWSGICFACLTVNNFVLILDKQIFPEYDLSTLRLVTALVALLPMLYGMILEDKS